MKKEFPNYRQLELNDCGPTCLRIIAKFYKKEVNINKLKKWAETDETGSSVTGLCNAAEKIGLRATGVKTDFNTLVSEDLFPCIAHWKGNHFIVAYKTDYNYVYTSDPTYGLAKIKRQTFIQLWTNQNTFLDYKREGVLILLYPSSDFHQ